MLVSLKKQQNKKAIITIILAIVFFISFLAMPGIKIARASTGTETVTDLEETRVIDDLLSSENFNILNYPFNDSDNSMHVINFVEFCYTYKLDLQENFGLYVYVYNPRGVEVDTVRTNKVTMATGFDSEMKPSTYEKFDLKFLDKTSGVYENLFYKFKLESSDFFLNLNSLQRNYYISEIEIQKAGQQNATAHNVSTLYTYTGFAKGFGSNSELSTLACEATAIETISLDVQHTYFRTGEVSNDYEASQINSVYFAVPNSVIQRYGSLYSIHAEWWEYMTREILITASNDVYNALYPFVGQNIENSSPRPRFGFGDFGYTNSNGSEIWHTGYNLKLQNWSAPITYNRMDYLYYIFKTNGVTGKYTLQGETLADYIYNYTKSYNTGTLDVNDRNISADLFLSEEEFLSKYWDTEKQNSTRKMGYNNVNITIEDSVNLTTITNNDWWQRLWGNDKTITEAEVSPIVIVKDDIMTMNNAEISENYLVSINDASDFKSYYQAQTLEDKTVILFRFASTNYKAQTQSVKYYKSVLGIFDTTVFSGTEHPSSIAQENVFLDFDVIDLTFSNEGIFYVIPVVSSPIDIISDIEVVLPTPPINWWTWILIIVILIVAILLLPILTKIFKFVFDAVVWIISAPFMLIEKLTARNGPGN